MRKTSRQIHNFRPLFACALEEITGTKVVPEDGVSPAGLDKCEGRLCFKLPLSLRHYYEVVGKLEINTEHNRLYPPSGLKMLKGKLAFMEENQAVVFWGLDLGTDDPYVFQANNEQPIQWFSEELKFSAWIITMLRWERGLGKAPRE